MVAEGLKDVSGGIDRREKSGSARIAARIGNKFITTKKEKMFVPDAAGEMRLHPVPEGILRSVFPVCVQDSHGKGRFEKRNASPRTLRMRYIAQSGKKIK